MSNIQPIRVLQIVMDLGRGSGVANVVLNWHRHIDRTKVQFDYLFCLKTPEAQSFEAEIRDLGGNVFYLPYRGILHPFSFLKAVNTFFKTHSYHTIHSHITQLNFFYFPIAKLHGIKTIIQHAHGTKWSDKKLNGWRNYIMLHAVWPLITHKLACSDAAGKVWYKKNYTVMNNGVDVSKFHFDVNARQNWRKQLGLAENIVIGHIGRFELPKNHFFLVDIFEQILQYDSSARLLLIGTGSLQQKVEDYIHKKQVASQVLFLGSQTDIPGLLSAMDILVMPSFNEGLPVVGVEAQATGLPCVFADTITKEVLLSNSQMLPLQASAAQWAKTVLSYKNRVRNKASSALCGTGFDIKEIAKKMMQLYIENE